MRRNKLLFVERESARLVLVEQRKRFVDMVIDELIEMHEGSLVRYRLRLSEFRDWKAKQR